MINSTSDPSLVNPNKHFQSQKKAGVATKWKKKNPNLSRDHRKKTFENEIYDILTVCSAMKSCHSELQPSHTFSSDLAESTFRKQCYVQEYKVSLAAKLKVYTSSYIFMHDVSCVTKL